MMVVFLGIEQLMKLVQNLPSAETLLVSFGKKMKLSIEEGVINLDFASRKLGSGRKQKN